MSVSADLGKNIPTPFPELWFIGRVLAASPRNISTRLRSLPATPLGFWTEWRFKLLSLKSPLPEEAARLEINELPRRRWDRKSHSGKPQTLKCQVLFKTSQSFLFQVLRRAGSEMILAFKYLAIKEAIIFWFTQMSRFCPRVDVSWFVKNKLNSIKCVSLPSVWEESSGAWPTVSVQLVSGILTFNYWRTNDFTGQVVFMAEGL